MVFDPSTVATKFTNSLQAVEDDDGLIDIYDLHGPVGWREIASAPFTEVLKQDGTAAGANVGEVVNYLNAEFNALAGGGPGGNKPTITSSLTESVVASQPFNYQIVATEGPTYFDASGLPLGLAVNNELGTIFGSTTVVGAVVIPITAVNGNGTTTANLNLTVLASGPGFSDTNSVRFDGPSFKQYLDVTTTAAIERDSSQAWSISQWVHLLTLVDSDIWAFGSKNDNIAFEVKVSGELVVRFKDSKNTSLEVEAGTLLGNTWYHLVVTNDGTETPAGIKIYVDGALQVNTTNENNMTGSAGGSGSFRIGRAQGGQGEANWLLGYINEWAYFDVELSGANVTSLYNGGSPDDLNAKPFVADMQAWLRMGDGDTFPILTDNEAGALHSASMLNMTILNFASFTP